MKAIVAILGLLVITAFVAGCQKQEPVIVDSGNTEQPGQPSTVEGTADLQTADDDFAAMDEAVDSLS